MTQLNLKKFPHVAAFLLLFFSNSFAWAVSQKQWLTRFEQEMPGALCGHEFFAKCFDISQAKCKSMALEITRKCVESAKAQLPEEFDQYSGRAWGEKIGSCAGGELEKALSDKRKQDPQCKPQ